MPSPMPQSTGKMKMSVCWSLVGVQSSNTTSRTRLMTAAREKRANRPVTRASRLKMKTNTAEMPPCVAMTKPTMWIPIGQLM